MKSTITPQKDAPLRKTAFRPLACITALVALLAIATTVRAQTDNFNSGTDSNWQKITDPNYPCLYTFPTDVFGGHAYRMQGLVPLSSGTPAFPYGGVNTARAAAVRTNVVYTDFYIAADQVSWNTSMSHTNDQAIGLIARASNISSGLLDGVVMISRINQHGNLDFPTNGIRGMIAMYWISGGGVGGPICQGDYTYTPGHSYRLIFTGTNDVNGVWGIMNNDYWTGMVYDLQDLTRPLLTLFADDTGIGVGSAPASGYSGLVAFGLRGNSDTNDTTADVTFDNFVAAAAAPTSVSAPATPHGLTGAPQVVNRTPASFANFYSAAGGITFNATTLTTTNSINTSTIRLILNGVDVSSGLLISGPTPPTNVNVSFHGLASNCVYNASIVLQDVGGHTTTNAWTFDTFSDAYLASATAANIECEDYDYSGGQFFPNPIVSGYATNGNPVNYGATGAYVDLHGLNANGGTPPVDFFDYDTNPNGATPPAPSQNQFRSTDPVGTQQGCWGDFEYGWQTSVVFRQTYDTQRQKYRTADSGLEEYMVEKTQGGEWLNYTRTFDGSKYYNVYLRHGCSLPQTLSLDQIGPTTNNLGTFSAVSSLAPQNWKYAPLRDNSGELAVVNLSGTQTVRLTVAPPQQERTREGLWLNYLAFVPSVPQVYSCAQVNGTYTPEVNVLVDTANKRLTVPQNAGSTWFYRIGWTTAVQITGISFQGGNIVLTYQ